MKLQIETINQKYLTVDIEETKTVYDLKKELSLYADVGVEPELQKLIYDGKFLSDNDQLSTYNIDVKKYLGITILEQPLEEPSSINVAEEKQNIQDIPGSSNASPADVSKAKSAECLKAEGNATFSAAQGSDIDDMVKRMTDMGFPKVEIRDALKVCNYNVDFATKYLIAGKVPECLKKHELIDMGVVGGITPSEVCRQAEEYFLAAHGEGDSDEAEDGGEFNIY